METVITNSKNGTQIKLCWCKILVEKILIPLGFNMPIYSKPFSHKDMGVIKVTPVPFFRRIFQFAPFFVSDQIEFRLQIQNPSKAWILYERFGNDILPIETSLQKDAIFTGRKINGEGDIEYFLSISPSFRDGVQLVTARIVHKDSIAFQWFWVLVGAFITFACVVVAAVISILSGLIQVNPEWVLFLQ